MNLNINPYLILILKKNKMHVAKTNCNCNIRLYNIPTYKQLKVGDLKINSYWKIKTPKLYMSTFVLINLQNQWIMYIGNTENVLYN